MRIGRRGCCSGLVWSYECGRFAAPETPLLRIAAGSQPTSCPEGSDMVTHQKVEASQIALKYLRRRSLDSFLLPSMIEKTMYAATDPEGPA